ncbi:MAG TPA: thiamine pyrophosphate-dependent enzyme [Halanaerobiales bacterium]|nr:thiamine pyrophosphate-dependent enzyme [Halanaerobiales bacterium]
MKSMGDMLLRENEFSEIVIGNTALVRAMVEAGTRVVTSYPGSPMPETAEAIRSIPKEKRPFYFEFSTNEKVATEIAFGASVNGHFSTVFFKSVGLNVAADSFVQLPLMKLKGGMVVVIGDDPGANSSQNEQDNRHYAHLSYMPVFEPSNPQEVYEFYKEAAKVSKEKEMPVILRLSTHVCHAKQKVNFKGYTPQQFDNKPQFSSDEENYVPITSEVFPMKRRALQRIEDFQKFADNSKLNEVVDNKNKEKGIITMGVPYLSLRDVMEDIDDKVDVLKLGIIYPLPRQVIAGFLKDHEEVKVLEELDNVLEKEIKVIAFEEGIETKIIGKSDIEDWINEYTPDKVQKVMKKTWPEVFTKKDLVEFETKVENRPAQLCPGCGHRSAFYAIKKALSEEDITVADIGCHTLGFLPPYEMGEVLLSMGHSTSTGTGLSLFNEERKVVSFLGDSTMFHAGLPGIVNAVFNDHNLTLVIMENGTTAMTGHQNHAGTGANFNEETEPIAIQEMLEGFGVENIYRIDTYAQSKLTETMKKAVNEEGFSVVIATHPCMLKFTREARREGSYKDNKAAIDQEVCRQIHECVQEFGCPSFSIDEDGKVVVNEDLCIGDGSCLQTCPIDAIGIKTNKEGSK